MRARRPLVALAVALPAALGLSSCALGEYQQGVDRATTCAEAVQVAQFFPDLSDPQKTQADAQAKAQEIESLANRTEDPQLKQNLMDLHTSIERLASGSVPATELPQVVGEQAQKTQAIASTCANITGG